MFSEHRTRPGVILPLGTVSAARDWTDGWTHNLLFLPLVLLQNLHAPSPSPRSP